MSFESDYRTACLAHAPLLALVGQRFQQTPLNEDEQYPCIGFTRTFTNRIYTQGGGSGIAVARVQADCWAASDEEAFALAEVLIDAYATFNLTGGAGRQQ